MKIIVAKNYDEMSAEAFKIMASVVKSNPRAVLGLATGSTPIGLYREMIRDHKENGTSYKQIQTVNLDEYEGLDYTSDQSYVYFMRNNLFDHIDIDLANTHIENGKAADAEAECARYNALLEALQQDIQILGIGRNGHIAFNEPAEALYPATHVTGLTEDTIDANARFFASADEVPTKALTMGMGTILSAKKIIILANGKGKHEAVSAMLSGMVTTSCPASFLNLHADVTLICDREAYEG